MLYHKLALLAVAGSAYAAPGRKHVAPPPPDLFGVQDWYNGMCKIVNNGRCVTDGANNYGNQERCTIRANYAMVATAHHYDIEDDWDYLSIQGTPYKEAQSPPTNVMLSSGDVITWTSDGSINRGGFMLCAHR